MAVLGVGWVLVMACGAPPTEGEPSGTLSNRIGVWFTDVADAVGVGTFHQVNGTPEKRHIPESTGAGAALFDYDNDDDLDIFLINGSRLGGFPPGQQPTNRLYRNEGGGERFRDVTEEAGLMSYGAWGQGCAVADVNGDGYLDLYVTNYGPNVLYLNNGNGAFTDVTAQAQVGDPRWSTGAAFLDYDRDGDLDLYVSNYIEFERIFQKLPSGGMFFTEWKGMKVMSGPKTMPPARDRFYRNNGDGTFTDVTTAAKLDTSGPWYGFQPTTGDHDNDGDVDIFVANDTSPNFLWRNNGDGTFTDVALLSGVAYGHAGNQQSSMGVAFDDYDGDGFLDIYVTNFSDDLNTLYHDEGGGFFEEMTVMTGLGGSAVMSSLAWGTFFFDADNDGDLDLFVANGHVYPEADAPDTGTSYAQKNQLFLRGDKRRFEKMTDASGPGFQVVKVSRGAALGDVDNDGDLDILVNNFDNTPTLLRNESSGQGRWLKVQLRGLGLNCTAIGARVSVSAGGPRRMREVRSSGSFLSHSDLRLHFGLGAVTRVERIEVRWPDGSTENVADLPTNVLLIIEQGKGVVETKEF